MRFARFCADGAEYYGVVEGGALRVISGSIFGEYQITGQTYAIDAVKLLAPVTPSKVVGVGLNYKSVAAAKGVPYPDDPILFLKPSTSVIGPAEDIVVPDSVKQPAFEVELAVVIGKTAKNVSVDRALDYCFGYCLCNDVTAKDHIPKGQPWTRGKSFDTFTPVGPYIVTDISPDDIELVLTVNGVEKQRGRTSDMIFGVRELIAFISSIMTLKPGDVIATGTPPGGDVFAKGDTIEISSPVLGVMRNKAV
ncbi:fumarylacetoacetate hydrolase family protein [Sporolituus thermophilus]|uniref:2-keto-4-pentenoate hydratase/2-oxohepta-3-ene-1,7-dioic acid hydratase (Catechol pathway) n=1 Tax=Sporolituus thermophilus DSM 23256 TaxID=1123285 RepID=A0A1G7HT76_9FIRM|nr:fumarylacetoacetate hydrolase family protein [Sporolituus thermophilus]SDF03635.1 2-keto-4-pentenoate hydratase/2-oxohepta-3-ene-1,7-dioic acid hydratase (catechol pathway) [Sporolituus thermophilus DSM 23256]